MWIIKLGGSVTRQDSLVRWLQLVATHGDGKVIIVPGGGVFADAVRSFQATRAAMPDGHLSDPEAHRLAVFAMDQMARSLVACVPELVLVRNPLEMAERGWQHRGLVWLPSEMVLHPAMGPAGSLPEHWETTSDSLAAWLAAQTEACKLLLIKSDDRLLESSVDYQLPAMQAAGILDQEIGHVLARTRVDTWVIHHSQVDCFAQGWHDSGLGLVRAGGRLRQVQ